MASLREIRDHIGSVRSTLKITSAMKLVASAKLRKAQQAAESLRDYSDALSTMLDSVLAAAPTARSQSSDVRSQSSAAHFPSFCLQKGAFLQTDGEKNQFRSQNGAFLQTEFEDGAPVRVAVVAVASNSSLCGAFNVNAVRKVHEVVSELKSNGAEVDVFAVGRKMSEAVRKAGFPQEKDWSALVAHPSFERTAELATGIMDAFASGKYASVLLVYNHFVSTGSQKVVAETWLPFGVDAVLEDGGTPHGEAFLPDEYILEPSREAILATLLPQVLRLRLHTAVLDSLAAEHAARTVAMQAASDNAEDLLGELTLEYNKGRQQKITAEILDIVGGAQR